MLKRGFRALRRQALLLCLAAGLFGGAPEPAVGETIRIAHPADYEPYMYVDASGESKGMVLDFWRLWAEKTRVEIRLILTNGHFQVLNLALLLTKQT